MEFVLLVVILLGFISNFFVMRFFFKRLSSKITFLTQKDEADYTPAPMIPAAKLPLKNGFATFPNGGQSPVSSPNQIANDNEGEEFNEQNFSSLPKDVKIDIEGGDTQTPMGFDEAKKA